MQKEEEYKPLVDKIREDPSIKKKILDNLTDEQADEFLHTWEFFARSEQLPPEKEWSFWLYLAGRGAGKTRAGAEFIRQGVKNGIKMMGLIAPTAADARDVMVKGVSGILNVCWEKDVDNKGNIVGRPVYQPSKRSVVWENGALAMLYSADEPERLRGPQHERIWADELCAWRKPEAWDLAMFGLRIGQNPQAFVSTTPKPKKVIRELLNDPSTVVTKGTTYSNRANLSKSFFDQIIKKYEGTSLGKQELEGILLEEAEGALWTRELIEHNRKDRPDDKNNKGYSPDFFFTRIVVGVDPAITSSTESAETGIVVVGRGNDNHCYILADYSNQYKPGEWAQKSVIAYNIFKADSIVAEGNQGGEMVKHTIRTVSSNVPVTVVYASRGKAARAEPCQGLYEQGKVHHCDVFSELENQMCSWEPLSGDKSPDRLDALVWGITSCMIGTGVAESIKLKGFY